ncbi:MAG: transposase [Syntrophobacteraceae bacterium]|jgi:transposase
MHVGIAKVIDARGKGAKGKVGSAEVALGYIGQLYRVEKSARAAKLSPAEIQKFRIYKAERILEEFKAWMETRKNALRRCGCPDA